MCSNGISFRWGWFKVKPNANAKHHIELLFYADDSKNLDHETPNHRKANAHFDLIACGQSRSLTALFLRRMNKYISTLITNQWLEAILAVNPMSPFILHCLFFPTWNEEKKKTTTFVSHTEILFWPKHILNIPKIVKQIIGAIKSGNIVDVWVRIIFFSSG